ncbi:MAG: putative RNA-binding Zn-ribbon protein involved in translation (DUF1610 family) [Verrucomicrobiales bacterium]|jgi:predicted RNA-binding Zn-ribbon protein involved in translation (DUF1610 family)
MSKTTALAKRSCAACGAQAEWNASKHALICPYCGTAATTELETDSGKIHEHDLVTALRELPEECRGWKLERRTVKCQSCKAISVFDPTRVGQNCDFCGAPELVDYEEIRAPVKPESLLPFKIDREQVYNIIKGWLGKRWFAPNALKRRSLIDTVVGIYIPYWTFDSKVYCPWTAESGDYYYTTESYRDSNGQQRTRQVQHTRWYNSQGSIRHTFDDVLITGTHVVEPSLLPKIEPFPTHELVPYDTGYVSGWIIEHYQVVLLEAAKAAREKKNRFVQGLCRSDVPGDTHRHLQIHPDYSEETFKHILVPTWILNYDYGRTRHQVLINGYTGQIAGRYPKSAWKIFFLTVFILIIIGLIAYFGNQ